MSEQLDREDRAIEMALSRCLEHGDADATFESMEDVDESLLRQYTELLGLLPYELEPATPSLSTKVRLLAVVGGDAGASGSMSARTERPVASAAVRGPVAVPAAERSVEEMTFQAATLGNPRPSNEPLDDIPMYEPSPVDVTLRHGTAEGVGSSAAEATRPSAAATPEMRIVPDDDGVPEVAAPGFYGSPPPRPSWATWAMAAMLGVCMLGLGFLIGQSREQVAKIADLEERLQQQPEVDLDAGDRDPTIITLQDDLATAQRRLRMVTEVAQSVYPMRTVSTQTAVDNRLDGTIYVCGQHQRWYLNVKGLAPPAPGKEYHLWFITEDGTIDGGVVDVVAGAMAEKDANSMPPGTRGFSVTLEDEGVRDTPEGLMVLLGEQAVSL